MTRRRDPPPAGVEVCPATPMPPTAVRLPPDKHDAVAEALADLIVACVLRYAGVDEANPGGAKRKGRTRDG